VEVRELLLDLALNKGVTIFVSSHILNEISKIATRIGIIHNSALIQEMDIARLQERRIKRLVLKTVDNENARIALAAEEYNTTVSTNGNLILPDEKALCYSQSRSYLPFLQGK